MRLKVVFAALTVTAALGGWATTEAADRDDSYPNGYYHHYYDDRPDRNHTYDDRRYPDRSDAYHYRDGRRYGYDDEHPQRYRDDYHNRADPYGIERHDTN